jgi:hypothetical protein
VKIATRAGDEVLTAVDSAIKRAPADRGSAAGEP